MTLCSAWLEAADVDRCDNAAPDLPRALLVASHLMYAATGRQFPGLCTDSVRPCSGAAALQVLDYPASVGGSRALGHLWPGAACGCGGEPISCGCRVHDAVPLPGLPVSRVVSVTVDGVALDVTPGTGDVRIVDDRWLIRSNGQHWPCCQNLAAPLTEPGTWGITYEYGVVPEPPALLAAEVLACELVAGWAGGDCNLPQRLTQLTYEGATMSVLDPFDFLDGGRFGIYEVDLAVTIYNPQRLQRTARVVLPRDYQRAARRVR